MSQRKLFLFGDQTFDVKPHLKDLLRYRTNPVLEDFLTSTFDVVRSLIYSLPVQTRDELPRLTCIDDLIFWGQEGKHCIPLDMAVRCMWQLGISMGQVGAEYPKPEESHVLGLCTGALASAAIACSRSTLELVPLAIEAVIVAFRIGLCVTDMAQRIEPTSKDQADQSWSMSAAGLAVADAVSSFCEQTNLPPTRRPFISAYAQSGVTISGPPSSLAQFKASEFGSDLRCRDLPVFAPFHSSRLFTEQDIEAVLAGVGFTARPCEIDIISGSGNTVEASEFGAALEAAVSDILLSPIKWDGVLKTVETWLSRSKAESFEVVPIGTSAGGFIYSALKQTPLQPLLPAKLTSSNTSEPESHINKFHAAAGRTPKLAIVGSSGRYPGAKDNEAFWQVLHQGLDMHRTVPAQHWDVNTHVDPTGKIKNTSAAAFGCWLDDPGMFDAKFFRISPREAAEIDPAQRIALMTAYEAIEQSGLVPDATPSTRRDRVGVFYGVTSNDWMETNSAQKISTYFIPGGNRAFIPGRINYCFKFSGPSYAVDTACSSSLAAIHIACNSLWRGDVDTAIAGGTNVLTNPDFTAGLDRGHFLSRTGNCKTFDDEADGYCRGEGVVTVIIKRLEDAIADKDPIQAVILATSTNHSAESESITRPHVGAQQAIFKKILNQAAVDPYDVGYVEMHGTGTQAGDAGEMSSVLHTFAPPLDEAKRARTDAQALYLGSAKANIGHGEAASGVSALVKVLLMMQKNTIVPHCGIKTRINSKFPTDLNQRNVHIAKKAIGWERTEMKPRRAIVNNFSAAGGNSAVLLEDAPIIEDVVGEDSRGLHVIALSGKSGASLQGNLKSMLAFVKQASDVSLGQLSYTTTARRIHHLHRVMMVVKDVTDLCSQLEAAIKDQVGMTRSKAVPSVMLTFTGNGAQYPGMGKELFGNFCVFRKEMTQLDRLGQTLGFPSVLSVILSQEPDISVFPPTCVQLATTCLQIALHKLLTSWGIEPKSVVGHSLGEYAALNVARVLSDADTLYLVGKRAQLLEARCDRDSHSMLVAKCTVKDAFTILKELDFEVACINSPIETVLAGPGEDMLKCQNVFAAAGVRSTILAVPYAFHSAQVNSILDDFAKVAQDVTFSAPKIPVHCPLDGTIVDKGGVFSADYLVRHCREPVNMLSALETAHRDGTLKKSAVTIEIGPHPAVSGMVKANFPEVVNLPTLQRGRTIWQTMTAALKTLYNSGTDISWSEYHRDFTTSHKVINLPAYSWDLQDYWLQYVNDWSLRKGDPPLIITNDARSKLETTTIHNIVEEWGDEKKAHIVVEADIARADLAPLVQGHEVNGTPLCTPSVYCDQALLLGTYIVHKYQPQRAHKEIDVGHMDISKALILNARGDKQPLQTHCDFDFTANTSVVKFMSFDAKGRLQEHARCAIRFTDRSCLAQLEREKADIKGKMQLLRDGIGKGITARYNRATVYRAIRPLARFHDDYRAIDEIVINSPKLEALCKLSFGDVKRTGDYHCHPAVIDALTQVCGFTMNCNDDVDLDTVVCMNHGWGGFQIFEPISFDKKYTTYTQMHEGKDKLWHGDVMVFGEADEIVAAFKAIAIQQVPRRVLEIILSMETKNRNRGAAASAAPAAEPQRIAAPKKAPSPKKQTKSSPPANVAPATSGKVLKALEILAEESGVDAKDMTDETCFADAGVDSLMGLTISARFKDELDLDLDLNSLFYELPTVKDLKRYLSDIDSSDSADTAASLVIASGEVSDDEDSGVLSLENDDPVGTLDRTNSWSTGITTPESGTPGSDHNGKNSSLFNHALAIVAEESGVTVGQLTDDTDFSDSGVDSLMSLVIVSRLRDELELDIPHDSLFLECPTVASLRDLLCGEASEAPIEVAAQQAQATSETPVQVDASPAKINPKLDPASLATRKKAVDELVEKYTAGWSVPVDSPSSAAPSRKENVVFVTGTTGSLGAHLAYHLAQLDDITTVVCLNRENRVDAETRQYKAMREKGTRFPESLKHKMRLLQTDATKPRFGLSKEEYTGLTSSVTHIIHNAWAMSAKKPLPYFESQFLIFRNLLDFASDISAKQPHSFKLGFQIFRQLVSSGTMNGHYELDSPKVLVPEERVNIDAVLTNGYSEAKWGCERMLDQTLHKYPLKFRPMVVRLGQIAGSKTSGYWNPTEHFAFLIKSSQTLNVLPGLSGGLFWTPVNDIAAALSDMILADNVPKPVYHIENPVGQGWPEMIKVLADCLNIPSENIIPFDDWLERVKTASRKDNPANLLLDFLDDNFLRMSCGGLVLDTKNAVADSPSLAAVGPVGDSVARKYIHIWREIGFLNSTAEERARFEDERLRLWGRRPFDKKEKR